MSGFFNTQPIGAENVPYDNATSGLTATEVQAAIDELVLGLDAQNEASEISYDNTASGLDGIDVQAAVDELADEKLDTPGFVIWENLEWRTLISGAGAPTAATGGPDWFYLDTTSGSEELYGPATFNPSLLPTGVWDWGSPLSNFTFSATGPTNEAGDWYVWDENGDGSVYTLFQKKTAINEGDMLFYTGGDWKARTGQIDANDVYVDLTNIDPAYGTDSVSVALSNLFSNKADKFVTFNDQTGTTYTLQGSDYGKMVTLDNASAITVTVPADTFIPGDVVGLLQKGAGQVTVAGDTGVTVNTPETLSLIGQWSVASLLCIGNNEFVLLGSLEAA